MDSGEQVPGSDDAADGPDGVNAAAGPDGVDADADAVAVDMAADVVAAGVPVCEPDGIDPRLLRVMRSVLDDAECDQVTVNRGLARRASRVAEAIRYARTHPDVYTELPGTGGVEVAEKAVIIELGSRLQLSENQIRNLAHTATTARARVPELWQAARDGFVPLHLVDATVTAITPLLAAADAPAQEVADAAARVRLVDEQATAWALTLTPGAFRARLRVLTARLDPRPAARRHADAMTERRVIVEDAADGMAWLSVLMPRIDAIGAHRHLTSRAKRLQKDQPRTRTRDQIRADLAADLLQGRTDSTGRAGTIGVKTGPVKTKIFVTIPIGIITGTSTSPDGHCTLCGGSGYPEQARIVGDETLDPATAQQLLLDTGAFTRVITDPVRSVVTDMERRARKATRPQREWLTLQHGTCARDGCTRLAIDAHIDHTHPWATGGATNLTDLRPLCAFEHLTGRHNTRLRYKTRPNGTVQLTTPTGHHTTQPPPF